jgi:ATP-dependent DNA helicase RecQ
MMDRAHDRARTAAVGDEARGPARVDGASMQALRGLLARHWGFERFRPLQEEAMAAVLSGRDSLIVLPTGGGKSLCYQAPALVRGGTAIVVSPLIALMKDQVDRLRERGIPAAVLNSTLDVAAWRGVMDDLHAGRLRLLYLAPERLVMDRTLDLVRRLRPSFVAVDEAHCISQWGHDFRPEYRALGVLRAALPGVGLHAYTATASPRVREDIVRQLDLRDPEILVGPFDRPNLFYRVQHRQVILAQVQEVIDRHPDGSGIVYCIRRADVERTCGHLVARGVGALPYHAGLPDALRHANQEAFLSGRARVIVATVAFGMGIDKADVRFVVHAGCPKSIEAYQQETGRAGRDGCASECALFYSGSDVAVWRKLLEAQPADVRGSALESLVAMHRYCTGLTCRRRALVRHAGQDLPPGDCGGCDVCRGEVEQVDDPGPIGRGLLSGVVRLGQRFGADYVAKVLSGAGERVIRERGHDRLATFGHMRAEGYASVRDWLEQLVGQGFLRKDGEYRVVKLTADGWRMMRGDASPRLSRPRPGRTSRSRSPSPSTTQVGSATAGPADSGRAPRVPDWDGVDRDLFEALRSLRRTRAVAARVPAYVIFPDETLRCMARFRPSTLAGLRRVPGVGDRKLAAHGAAFLELIQARAMYGPDGGGPSVDDSP